MTELERTIKALEVCSLSKTCVPCPLTEECKGFYNAAMAQAANLLKDPDRVKVVRCADCRYWKANNAEEGDASGMCMNGYSPAGTTDMNWFCADGEREG